MLSQWESRANELKYTGKPLAPGSPDKDRWFNENSDVGGSGFFQFDLSSTTDPKRTLMGIHAGRMDKGGYTWWTHGCIRTTPVGSSYLFDIYHGSGSLPPLFVH